MDEGLEKAQAELAQHPEDVDLYWHAGRFMFEVGERFDRTDKSIDKVAWYENMVHVFERGLQRDPKNPHLLFGLGIAKGRLGTTKGVLASLFMAKDVEAAMAQDGQLVLQVLEHPRAGTAAVRRLPLPRHLLPLVPDSFDRRARSAARAAASTSRSRTSSAPITAAGADRHPQGARHLAALQGPEDEERRARRRWTLDARSEARAVPPEADTDVTDIHHIDMILANPKLACGYSRDGQQDLDDEKLKAQTPEVGVSERLIEPDVDLEIVPVLDEIVRRPRERARTITPIPAGCAPRMSPTAKTPPVHPRALYCFSSAQSTPWSSPAGELDVRAPEDAHRDRRVADRVPTQLDGAAHLSIADHRIGRDRLHVAGPPEREQTVARRPRRHRADDSRAHR
jgi:hypothetical protein